MSTPETIVRDFLAHLEHQETEAALALLAPDVQWRNTGLPTLKGPRVASALQDMGKRGIGFRVALHHVAADGESVLTDRTDWISWKRWETAFWVRGTFVVRDGQIVLWDDAFGWGSFLGGSVKGLVRAVLPR